MRELTSHKVNAVNDGLKITVVDEPGHGAACHKYRIEPTIGNALGILIEFQNGPIKEVGINGVTHEALLAILIDRLEGFQSGKYACADNQEALEACRTAQKILKRRTEARAARGVEGTHQV